MRRRSFLSTTVMSVAAATALSAWAMPAPARPRARPASGPVVLIDWDGIDPRYLDAHLDSRLPHLRSLSERGSRSTAACTYKAVSNPNRAGLATGARPRVHGNAAYVLDPARGRVIGQTRDIAAETVAQSLRRQGRSVLSAGWYIIQDKGVSFGDPEGLYTQGDTWEDNVDTVVRVLRGLPVDSGGTEAQMPRVPDLIAVYAADIDALGHADGPTSQRIPSRLAELDTGLGRITAAVREAGLQHDTTFVFVSDHGMTGYTESVEPRVLGALSATGHTVRRLHSGQEPDPGTEIVVTATPRAANVYLRGAADTPQGRERIKGALRGVVELEAVHDRAALDSMGAAAAEGDFVVEARPPYAFVDPDAVDGRERGAHASLREATVPLILSGAGAAKDHSPRKARVIDVIPTISRLLGVEPPADAEGRVLTEALRPPFAASQSD
ncbi:MAG: alkaline phosphatase family protein [Nocardiopsaceae bacterium]|nr:alkaline phosphatase family protein [Nocardiopsaceae bacterium]